MSRGVEMLGDLRGLVGVGLVQRIDDTGQAQAIDVQMHDGAVYAGVRVAQAFGHASMPPVDGAIALVFAVGGDPANLVALIEAPSTRFGGLVPGEAVLYGADGSRIAVRNGGTIEVLAATTLRVVAPGVTIEASAGITITGDVTITGTLSVSGPVHGTIDTAHHLG